MERRRITIYTKPGCHLCEEVEEVVREVAREWPLTIEKRSILDDLKEYARYRHEIPVVLLDGTEIARYRLTREELLLALGVQKL